MIPKVPTSSRLLSFSALLLALQATHCMGGSDVALGTDNLNGGGGEPNTKTGGEPNSSGGVDSGAGGSTNAGGALATPSGGLGGSGNPFPNVGSGGVASVSIDWAAGSGFVPHNSLLAFPIVLDPARQVFGSPDPATYQIIPSKESCGQEVGADHLQGFNNEFNAALAAGKAATISSLVFTLLPTPAGVFGTGEPFCYGYRRGGNWSWNMAPNIAVTVEGARKGVIVGPLEDVDAVAILFDGGATIGSLSFGAVAK